MIDRTFPADFDTELLDELPDDSAPRWFYPGGTTAGGQDGLLVRVTPAQGDTWIGTFAFGSVSRNGVNGVFTCPRAGWICVVSKGRGYLVNTLAPSDNQELSVLPILGVFPAASARQLVLHDFTRFLAVGPEGVVWITPRLSWDGFRGVTASGDRIIGEASDSPSGHWIPFAIDLPSGTFRGGASPELLRQGPY
jgi:hypothetical protein